MQELGLTDSTDVDDFPAKLESFREAWDNLRQGFHKWLYKKRGSIFERNAIESTRVKTEVQRLKQCYKKESIEDAILTLRKLVICQQDDEQYIDPVIILLYTVLFIVFFIHQLYLTWENNSYKFYIVYSPSFCLRVKPPTKFSKTGAWQDLNFERGVSGKEGGNFFQGGLQF